MDTPLEQLPLGRLMNMIGQAFATMPYKPGSTCQHIDRTDDEKTFAIKTLRNLENINAVKQPDNERGNTMSDEMPRFNWGEPDEFGTKPPPEKYLKPSQAGLTVTDVPARQLLNEAFATLYYGAVAEFVKIEETDTEIQMILKVVANLERLNGALRKNAEANRKQLDRLAKYDNFLDAAGSILAEINQREW